MPATIMRTTTGQVYVLSIGGTLSVTNVQASGQFLSANGAVGAPGWSWTNESNSGWYRFASTDFRWSTNGVDQFAIRGGTFALADGVPLQWGASGVTNADVIIRREAAAHLFQRNTTNAQRFSVANTYTSSTNYEAASADWQTQANTFMLGTRTAATGTSRPFALVSQSNSGGDFYTSVTIDTAPRVRMGARNAAGTWAQSTAAAATFTSMGEVTSVATSGTIVAAAIIPTYNQSSGTAANTDLLINRTQTAVGSGAQRLIDAQVGGVSQFFVDNGGAVSAVGTIATTNGNISATGGSATVATNGFYAFSARSKITAASDGVVLLSNNAISDFSRLQFGGTTSSFPALKRSAASVQTRLADDSANATLHAILKDVRTESAEATDGNVTYTTTQVLGGIITRSNMGSNRVDAFPTAANLVAAIPGCMVGTSFDLLVNNDDTAQTVTVNGASTGITYQGTATAIAAGEARLFRVLITNITGAAEAATVFQVV